MSSVFYIMFVNFHFGCISMDDLCGSLSADHCKVTTCKQILFKDEEAALTRFENEFGAHIDEMTERCLYIENEHGEAIATTTAWYGDLEGYGEGLGRIHWVGVIPEYQGRKLSKPLLSEAMNILARDHSKAYLTSQTTSYQAVNMYLNYGFEPYLTSPTCDEAWALMEKTLNRKIIKD